MKPDSSSGSWLLLRRLPSRSRRDWTWWRSLRPRSPRVPNHGFRQDQYQEQKRSREAKKHQRVIEVKEIKFRPKVDEHDYQFKKKHIERFLADGDKVKATIFFRGREMAHPDIGQRILERLMNELADVAMPETMPRQEGNQMHVILSQRTGRKSAKPSRDPQEAPEPATTKD